MQRGYLALVLTCGLVLSAGACSEDSEQGADGKVTTDGAPPGKEGLGPDTAPAKKKVGEACKADTDCESGICSGGKCAKACTQSSDCSSAEDCGSDDGKRLLCYAPKYDSNMGISCAVSGSCPGSLICTGGPSSGTVAFNAEAYCSGTCKTDQDCPPDLACRKITSGSYCIKRSFCHECLYDGMCKSGLKCVKKQGGSNFCSRACTKGSTECPRYAECKDLGSGSYYCMHKSGACTGSGKLCDACNGSWDCSSDGMCLTFTSSDESFCATPCSSGSCASGYTCYTSYNKCVPDSTVKSSCVSSLSYTMEIGDIMEDFAMVGYKVPDTKLRVIKLSDFASTHKIIMLNVSAGWCSVCKTETATFSQLLSTYGTKGLMIFQTLYDGAAKQSLPTQSTLDGWVSSYTPTGAAVGLDPQRNSLTYFNKNSTPLNMLIDAKTRKVLDKWHGYSSTSLDSKLKTRLP